MDRFGLIINFMRHKFIEATNVSGGGFNWGKFLLLQFDKDEWQYKSQLKLDDPESQAIQDRFPLLHHIGFSPSTVFVLDLQTREGAGFVPRGIAEIDLANKRIWCCPMYQPFLQWLYTQNCKDITQLPAVVQLDAEGALWGYRREGEEFYDEGSGI